MAAIRERIAALGALVDVAILDAIRAMLEDDQDLASMTILRDVVINRLRGELDSRCHRFVARHLPSAGHLRFISASLRISTALERVGDYAVGVAKEALHAPPPPAATAADMHQMSEQARSMLKQALAAFRETNHDLARGTIAMESEADRHYRKIRRGVESGGELAHLEVGLTLGYIRTFSRLERITDQAKNICEQTIFAATGEPKQQKVFGILFLDERNTGASLMAEAIATKAYSASGSCASAGWNPGDDIDPDLTAFMDRHGQTLCSEGPRQFDPAFEQVRKYQVIVALSPGIQEQIPELPYSTVLLDWSEDVSETGPRGRFEDTHREALFKLLAPKIGDLMEILYGDQAD